MNEIGIDENSPASILFRTEEFEKAELQNGTLSWSNVEQPEMMNKIGKLVREARIKYGMTQQELAVISGTSRTYISRLENDRSDIELDTLRKIVETGLGKRL